MSDTISRKIYVRPDNTAVITCPHCNRQKTVPVGSYMGSKSRVKIKCGCKNVFTVNLEFRKKKTVRKPTCAANSPTIPKKISVVILL